jgi:hypothetical protein
MSRRIVSLVLGVALAGAVAAAAQVQTVAVPNVSQRATVSQRIGLTDVTIVYHRPLVGGRTIWGGLVPYGQPWRAGANENTTIAFSHDVTVEGKPLPAGTYGLHMLPSESEWTVVFSKNHTSWGSFSYKAEEDALRVTVKPAAAPHHEALTYEFDDPKADSVVVALKWEKLAVPFKVGVDVKAVVLANIRNELRSLPGFSWQGLQSAADWCAQEGVNFEEALTWADRAVQAEERFETLQTKAQLLGKLGKATEAAEVSARAIGMGNAQQLHFYGRQLLGEGKAEEAMKIFKRNVEKNPGVWFVKAGLARGYAALGDFDNAVKTMKEVLASAPEPNRANIEGLLKRLEKKENIN